MNRLALRSFFICIIAVFNLHGDIAGAETRSGITTSRIHEVFDVRDFEDSTNVTSLRGAILAINRCGGSGVIRLQEGTYTLTIQGADEFEGLKGDLNVTRGIVRIEGAGSNTVIDASSLGDRVLHVHPKAQLILSSLVIEGGTSIADSRFLEMNGESGGAILNEGVATVINCAIRGNQTSSGDDVSEGNEHSAAGGNGGAICNKGSVNMKNWIVEGNACGAGGGIGPGGNGGGIWNSGAATLRQCKIVNNAAGAGGDGSGNFFPVGTDAGGGGGIFNEGTIRIYDSSVDRNRSAAGSGAGQPWVGELGQAGLPGGSGGDGA